ncbi:MAG TPA: hypothetical protein VMB03_11285 [Bryobacteraceae bacterium]|nr:hypothetical protein [Bryobacteraceae bacterium]
MRITSHAGRTVWLWAVLSVSALHAEKGVLSFVFGPASPDTIRQAAHGAASAARHWVQTEGGAVELRRPGSAGVQQIDASMDSKQLEQAFLDAAQAAREADPPSFLMALDAAAQAVSVRPGLRVVVAVLNTPSFSDDGERRLENLGEICRSHGVRVLVLDVAEDARRVPAVALHGLVEKTGGAWIHQPKDLEAQVASVPPPAATGAPAPAAPPPSQEPAPKPAEEASSTGFKIPFAIPVHIRLMRIPDPAATSENVADKESGFGETITIVDARDFTVISGGDSSEPSSWPNDPHAPLQGMITVETPLTGFRFDRDDKAGTYQVHARITAAMRDAKGVAVWNGRKDVDLHGMIGRMDARRQGSIYFMRAVTLVGEGPFTLEAKVEDLVGHTIGTVQETARMGRNAPGLMASDALVVRPFRGLADAVEADQMLSYNSEPLSPVLDPVYSASKPVDMQIYLRLYPQPQGPPLNMSMEVQDNLGKVMGRMPLPFKGAPSSSGSKGSNAPAGAQAKELPYLVNMKGARLPAGDYQAVISIHQGEKTIKRLVAFKVIGSGMAPGSAATGPDATDDSDTIVLPEIEPDNVDTSGVKMRDVDQKALWDSAAKNAMGYLAQLPNFVCIQETHRFTAPAKLPDQLAESDSYLDELVFEDGKERYQRLEANGEKVNVAPSEQKGVMSRYEFGSMLSGLFDPALDAKYHWAGRSMTLGVLCQVFEFEVPRAKSNFVLRSGNTVETAGYTGRVFIDEDSGMVRRLTIEGTGLTKDFGLQSPSMSLDYGMVKIGEKDYLLPLRSVLQLRQAKTFVRNEKVFRGYRKWQADSQIKFGK